MKIIKKAAAMLLALIMVISLTSCIHKKNETAVTVGDIKFTSAYYMCALLNADSEAKEKVYEEGDLTEEEEAGTEEIDYFSKKIDDKSFVTWVEDRAIEMLKNIAAYKMLCEENELEVTEDQRAEAEEAVSYYWDSYGYSSYFEPNGVSKETYLNYTIDSYYAENYFMSIYGAEGTKALSADEVEKEITDNYILVDVVESAYTDELTDEQKEARKKLLEQNGEYLKNGEKTFESIYKEFNNIQDDTEEEEDSDEVKPINKYATVLGAEGTGSGFENEYYEDFKDYEIDEPEVIEAKDESGAMLVIRRDITKDKYYMDMLDSYARHALADEEFEKEIQEYLKDIKTDINKYAVGQFKVKNIIIPDTAS